MAGGDDLPLPAREEQQGVGSSITFSSSSEEEDPMEVDFDLPGSSSDDDDDDDDSEQDGVHLIQETLLIHVLGGGGGIGSPVTTLYGPESPDSGIIDDFLDILLPPPAPPTIHEVCQAQPPQTVNVGHRRRAGSTVTPVVLATDAAGFGAPPAGRT
ncbi:hypothetical protein ACP4OV_005694 [Aristida adscensionis]